MIQIHSLTEINSKPMYLDFFDLFGGRIMADGLDNFYDVILRSNYIRCIRRL